ncbi:hypothetical protein L7F22_050893 [Adiantum nelumboides]|nr:hypothetical protein [Adiantum nelumboides]
MSINETTLNLDHQTLFNLWWQANSLKLEIIQRSLQLSKQYGTAGAGDVIGEIGALCYKPQPFTVRSRKLCQLLRINRNSFLNLVQGNVVDGQIVVHNLYQFLKDSRVLSMLRLPMEIESIMADIGMGIPLSLCFVASKGSSQLLEHLLENGRDPNETDFCGRTPLHITAANGFFECVQNLLLYGADPNIQDDDGNVPLWEAIQGRHKYVAECLWTTGARLAFGKEGDFMCRAAEAGGLDVLEDLLKYHIDINSQNADGSTALHVAVVVQNLEVARFLLEQGASSEIQDARGLTPCDLAEQQKQEDFLELFLSIEKKSKEKIAQAEQVSSMRNHEGTTIVTEGFPISAVGKTRPSRQEASSWNANTNLLDRKDLPMRVTIHRYHPEGRHVVRPLGKLINLPCSLDEVLKIASGLFLYSPVMILSNDLAEVNDISAVRNDDHLYVVDEQELTRLLEDINHD